MGVVQGVDAARGEMLRQIGMELVATDVTPIYHGVQAKLAEIRREAVADGA